MTFKDKVKELVNNKLVFNNLQTYVDLIEEKNKVMNLTGYSGDRLWEEGIYDSLISLWPYINKGESIKLADIGSGVGFPSLPIKIAFPEVELTVIESQMKRVNFLKEVSQELNLNIRFISDRVEKVELKNEFDLVTARAVAELKALMEVTCHLTKIGGIFAFVKGPKIVDEIKAAGLISKELGLNFRSIDVKERPKTFIAYCKKTKDAPSKYPRDWAQIVK